MLDYTGPSRLTFALPVHEVLLFMLQAMTAEEFSRHKASLISNKLQTDMSLGQEGDRAWEQVRDRRSDGHCFWSSYACLRI